MIELTIINGEERRTVQTERGRLLADLLREQFPSFALPCAGNHTCGTCKVTVRGTVSPPEAEETACLGAEAPEGLRLACACYLQGDAVVTLQENRESDIVSWYKQAPFARTEAGYGFAVDIGTTTVVVQLIERSGGTVVAERLAENAQRGFGADVISRIDACRNGGLETLSARIREQVEEMAAECLRESGVSAVQESVITGNSTMLHLHEGLDPSSLAVAPFRVQSYFGCFSRHTLAGAPVYLPRCVGAYVGADILCAATAAGLTDGGTQLLADIGTNGEIMLAGGGRVICCATAAGPAFEGAELSCGMPAAAGAIRRVRYRSGAVTYETVGQQPAVGICGSGILDALAVMLETKATDDTGYLEEPWRIGDSGVVITQKDVRQIQLAKSAICAGVKTLLDREGVAPSAVDRFVIAGGFGSSMDQTSAAAIGLFPAALQEKADFIGNGALGGAVMLLLNRELREKTERMAKEAVEISLSASEAFMDDYIDCMFLGRME